MPEGHDATIEVCNIMSFVLYTQLLKQSVLKPASPGITLIWSQKKMHSESIAKAIHVCPLQAPTNVIETYERKYRNSCWKGSHTNKEQQKHPMSSNSHPMTAANKSTNCSKGGTKSKGTSQAL